MTAATRTAAIESLEPKNVWAFFAGLAEVPRPSKKEVKIRAHIHEVARRYGLRCRQEEVGNVIIDVPATPGRESAPVIVLQGHLDMVPEKNSDTVHDFENDPIRLILDEDAKDGRRVVHADGTTLGADNGMGVSLALAAATADNVAHGPLELLFTTDEEAGMTGAKALVPDSFKGRRLINLDSEEDDCLYIGCAGGCDTNLNWRFDTAPCAKSDEVHRIVIEGLRGGHSGCDIHENRANAIRLLVRTLLRASRADLRIGSFSGGSMRNAIPREARAVVAGSSGLGQVLQDAAKAIRDEAAAESFEDNVAIRVEPAAAGDPEGFMDAATTTVLLSALAALPSGVIGMHPKIPTLVQTSNNLSTTTSKAEPGALRVVAGTLSRSSSDSCLRTVTDQIAAIGRLSGAQVNYGNSYPGWEPNVDSPMLATCRRLYESLFKTKPRVAAIHAGLECGIIGQRVGDMDMISFGPSITGAHSPDERVYVDSVEKTWNYLVAVLDELSKG
jgi:dipeptidase D